MKLDMLDGPIPGESLTRTPGNAPWEQPAKFVNPEDALAFYMEKFEDEEKLEDMLFLFDQGYPVSVMVETMLTMGVMEGLHSIDISIIIAPLMHEYFVSLAEAADIDVVESDQPSKEERKEMKRRQRLAIMMGKMLNEEDGASEPEPLPTLEEQVSATEPKPQGLVPRRA